MKPTHYIVYSFQSFKDPLFTGLMYRYLYDLQTENPNQFVFHLITHEQSQFQMNNEEKEKIMLECKSKNIIWYPVKYHNGRFLILKKAYDFAKTFFISLYIRLKFHTKLIIGFLPIAGGFGAILGTLLNMKLAVYCYEPHSEYMSDFGIWKRSSLKFKLLNVYEKIQLNFASYIVVPTSHSLQLIKNSNAKRYVLPISVDTDLFQPNASSGLLIREKYGLKNKIVFLYTGKFGGIYYSVKEVVTFLNNLILTDDRFHIMIISAQKSELLDHMTNSGINKDRFLLLDYVDYNVLQSYINASDIGIIAVPSLPSQKYRTPVKTGLYLSCGKPYLINKGIAEDDIIAAKENIGVVLDDFQVSNLTEVKEKIITLLNSHELQMRCRKYAESHRSIKYAKEILKEIITNSKSIK